MSEPTPDQSTVSNFRRYTLLLLFAAAQFLDAFNISALFCAIPLISEAVDLTESESVWLVSAFQLTFASFLLLSGRVSDIYNAKYAFVIGMSFLAITSLVAGFAHNKFLMLFMRAFGGIAAAFTIPTALTLIVRLFPEPDQQALALGTFGANAALGNVLGLIIGGIFAQFTTWRWIFRFGAIVGFSIAFGVAVLTPKQPVAAAEERKIKNLDLGGITILTTSLVLMIFALTSTGQHAWASVTVLIPLIISIFLLAGFFYHETRVPAKYASFPPHTWFYPNFAIIIAIALAVWGWFSSLFVFKVSIWQDVYGWGPFKSALHLLPVGICAGPVMLIVGAVAPRFQAKYLMLVAQVLLLTGTAILPFADSAEKYWKRDFPALSLGALGGGTLYITANVAIFTNTPPQVAGVVGAIFNSALQLGSAVLLAVVSSIQNTVDTHQIKKGKDHNLYDGRAAGFYFYLGVMAVELVAVLFFYKVMPITYGKSREGSAESSPRTSDVERSVLEKKNGESAGLGHSVVPVDGDSNSNFGQ